MRAKQQHLVPLIEKDFSQRCQHYCYLCIIWGDRDAVWEGNLRCNEFDVHFRSSKCGLGLILRCYGGGIESIDSVGMCLIFCLCSEVTYCILIIMSEIFKKSLYVSKKSLKIIHPFEKVITCFRKPLYVFKRHLALKKDN